VSGFDTVLIANRGEIARRIIRTARAQGLRTVAVYSDADRAAPHVREADAAVRLGPAPAAQSYLRVDAILDAAGRTGAGAVHPGYGFLAENADAARAVETAGLAWVGPTPDQLEAFGLKHRARALAEAAGVPLLPGTGVLDSLAEAETQAEMIGYPVILKATGGGGGIGMRACADRAELRAAWDAVSRQAAASFAAAGLFLEKLVRPARHVEVQLFGDGAGRVAVLGDRDCSLQRRNQKVVEEAPAPGLPDEVRETLHASAAALAADIRYRSAGTAEFVYDPVGKRAYFLEVNARLQVEHPVTEAVFGVDLVGLMLDLAAGNPLPEALFDAPLTPTGHAVEARVYAEDPDRDNTPSTGLVTAVRMPVGEGIRVDTWIEPGLEVTPFYDPLLAKVIAFGPDRHTAFDRLEAALADTRVDGIVTGAGMLRSLAGDPVVRAVAHSTSTVDGAGDPDPRIEVVEPGMMTTVQDLPGRIGYWQVGVPPSGPMDAVSFRAANIAVGNPEGAPALEATLSGPSLRFTAETVVAVTGAGVPLFVDDVTVPMWEPIVVPAGGVLRVGAAEGPGIRTYLAIRGGLDVPAYLGSASTFTLGGFGGHGGRALVGGDVLRPGTAGDAAPAPIYPARRPHLTGHWQLAVTEGPHAAPEFFTREDIDELYAAEYRVQVNSARTGVRLSGPRPRWARTDGGEAGLHPSNIHDTPYAVGALDFTGDTPVLLGPDGPSLGGFVCPVVVASGDLWKLGQLRPGDTVRFVPVREEDAAALDPATPTLLRSGKGGGDGVRRGDGDDGILFRRDPDDTAGRPRTTYRRDGDDNVLVEFGDQVLDLGLRMRVHALQAALAEAAPRGILDVTPGIRSLQIHTDAATLRASHLVGLLRDLDDALPPTSELSVPSREVHLPLSWDDPVTRLAIERYMAGVRDDAPWTPSNIEFIRRINGLDSVDDVYRTVFDAQYLVMGLGDVYLGAPVATPLDPRHRLVTTKYNPARTWTAENSVGIGGAYLCIYGMEGPGGYQFVGRTVQIWNRFRRGGLFAENPWALRFFDRIRWYPVSAEELLELRAETDAGRAEFRTVEGTFALAEHERFLADNADDIARFRARQGEAFAAERDRWRASGEFDRPMEADAAVEAPTQDLPPGAVGVRAPFAATVWKVEAAPGAAVTEGDRVVVLEAMKMESPVTATAAGSIVEVYVRPGERVAAGQLLAAVGVDR
jgi:urea carboxylase